MDNQEPKSKIAISIDAELLRRLDEVCHARQQSRSKIINRILIEQIDEEESFVRGLENPAVRAVMSVMINTPGVVESMAKLVGEKMSSDDIDEMREGFKKQADLGKKRRGSKKKTKSKHGGAQDILDALEGQT